MHLALNLSLSSRSGTSLSLGFITIIISSSSSVSHRLSKGGFLGGVVMVKDLTLLMQRLLLPSSPHPSRSQK